MYFAKIHLSKQSYKEYCMSAKLFTEKPKKGDTLFLVKKNRNKLLASANVTVTSVGRKYFTTTNQYGVGEVKFNIDTMREATEYSADFFIYPSEQVFLDTVESDELFNKISRYFQTTHTVQVDTETLRKIDALLQMDANYQAKTS